MPNVLEATPKMRLNVLCNASSFRSDWSLSKERKHWAYHSIFGDLDNIIVKLQNKELTNKKQMKKLCPLGNCLRITIEL